MKIIITGSTGMVGEGVLMSCLENNEVDQILMINRKPSPIKHNKLKELIIPDFMKLDQHTSALKGYDGCFYCAGISSIGLDEAKYSYITYDTTMHFAQKLSDLNPSLVFVFVSGSLTDSTEKGSVMWARVKGKTENALIKLFSKNAYNFRPGVMMPVKGQKNVKGILKPFIWLFPLLLPKKTLTLQQVGQAMINAVKKGFKKQVLEISDIRELAGP